VFLEQRFYGCGIYSTSTFSGATSTKECSDLG
jgi:hypothetical protein